MWWWTSALAAEVEVGPGLAYESVQAAIDANPTGPLLIHLAPGEHAGFDVPRDRALSLRGQGAARTVVRVTDPIRVEARDLPTRLGLAELTLAGDGTDALLELRGDGAWRATVELDGVVVTGGAVRALDDGYGNASWERDAPVEIDPGGLLIAKDTSFVRNSGARGGHLAVLGGELRVLGGSLREGSAAETGGAVFVEDGLAHLEGARLTANAAPDGAAARVDGGSLVLVDVDVADHVASGRGAASVGGGGSLAVLRGRFAGNTAAEGAAIFSEGALRAEGALFAGNVASGRGAVACRNACELVDNRFTGNQAPEGSAFYLEDADGRHARNAVCASIGNAVSIRGSNVELTSTLFWANVGDPLRVDGGAVDVRHAVFGDNHGDQAAAVHQRSGRVVVSDSLFAWNGDLADDTPGSALLVRADEPADVTLSYVAAFENGVESSPGIASLGARLTEDPRVHTMPSTPGGPGRICALADWKLRSDSPLIGAASTPGEDLGIHAGQDAPEPREDADGDGALAPYDCDDSDPSVVAPGPVYPHDVDSDGFADAREPGASFQACPGPNGRAPERDDCDDRDPDVHPGAFEDLRGVDRDCDGWADPSAPLRRACGTAPGGGWLALAGVILLRSRRSASASCSAPR